MSAADATYSKLEKVAENARGILRSLGRRVTLPVALALAFIGQFALGFFVMVLAPPPDPGADASGGFVLAQGVLLVIQAAALLFAAFRRNATAGRIFLAVAGVVWAIASMLIMYVALQCDLAGVCL